MDHAVETPVACPVSRPRKGLRPADKVELALVGLVVIVSALSSSGLAWEVPFGRLVAYAAVVVLGQGLVRDVARLALRRLRGGPAAAVKERLLCLCAESTAGLTLVAAGIGLTLLGVSQPVVVGQAGLTGGLLGLLLFGFFAKDYVLVLRRVEDHGTIALGSAEG